MAQYKDFLGLGIAGNFALHLAQAGELEEFKDIITADEAAPKGMFPFYLPTSTATQGASNAKEQLYTYPISDDSIQLPNADVNVQAEPEVGLICKLVYENEKLAAIIPTHFGAYNDCSIRVAGASKISDKKNWGADSKGLSNRLIEIDTFESGGVMDHYSICSFLRRNEILEAYGENVELTGYSYFYEKLTEWMKNQILTQEDFGPLEAIQSYILASSNPQNAIISIGATRYTPYGESTFLQEDDEVLVVLYDRRVHSLTDVISTLNKKEYNAEAMSLLVQRVYK